MDFDPFVKHCYCTCLRKMFEVNYLEKNLISVQQPPLCLPLFFVSSSDVLNSGIKSYFEGVVLQDAVCEECFKLYVFGVFTFSFLLLF